VIMRPRDRLTTYGARSSGLRPTGYRILELKFITPLRFQDCLPDVSTATMVTP
jgi:hypothetical protein